MIRPRNGILAALDVGSSKISCFIARVGGTEGLRVLGVGHHASSGIRHGSITDMDAAHSAILAAVGAAEEMAGVQIESVIVNGSGGKPSSRSLGVEIAVSGQEIADADLRRVLSQGYSRHGIPDQELIHCIPVGYSVDGNRGVREPRGMFGERLGVNMHLITADSGAIRNLANCIARAHLKIDGTVVAPYAAGLSCLVEDERELGVTLVDMGGTTTTIAVFSEGDVVHTDWIPVGGSHVTNDVARGLSTPLGQAERMKILYGSAIATGREDEEVIDVPLIGEQDQQHPNHMPRSMLNGIIRPRLEETLELVRNRLETSGASHLAGRRLVLTGGASQLPGVRELAALILEKQVRMGAPAHISGLADSTAGPAFAVCTGMLLYAIRPEADAAAFLYAQKGSNRLGRISQWLRENFQ